MGTTASCLSPVRAWGPWLFPLASPEHPPLFWGSSVPQRYLSLWQTWGGRAGEQEEKMALVLSQRVGGCVILQVRSLNYMSTLWPDFRAVNWLCTYFKVLLVWWGSVWWWQVLRVRKLLSQQRSALMSASRQAGKHRKQFDHPRESHQARRPQKLRYWLHFCWQKDFREKRFLHVFM